MHCWSRATKSILISDLAICDFIFFIDSLAGLVLRPTYFSQMRVGPGPCRGRVIRLLLLVISYKERGQSQPFIGVFILHQFRRPYICPVSERTSTTVTDLVSCLSLSVLSHKTCGQSFAKPQNEAHSPILGANSTKWFPAVHSAAGRKPNASKPFHIICCDTIK